jgi:hypothetical protein
MSIIHIINDYTNQISKYVDVEYGQVRLWQATYEVILSMEKFNYMTMYYYLFDPKSKWLNLVENTNGMILTLLSVNCI